MHNWLGHLDQVPQMNLAAALKIIAASAIRNAFDDWIETGWEQMPDMGEMDFGKVVAQMLDLIPTTPSASEYDAAMKFLIGRVDNTDG